nr:HepT-like ribonuclease domain-containing protein [Devosia sp. YR412]
MSTIRELLNDRTFEDAVADKITRLATERCVEIISEASKHIPGEMKTTFGASIPWRSVVGTGDILRHAYHREEFEAIWAIYSDDLDPLEAVIDAMIASIPPAPPNS